MKLYTSKKEWIDRSRSRYQKKGTLLEMIEIELFVKQYR